MSTRTQRRTGNTLVKRDRRYPIGSTVLVRWIGDSDLIDIWPMHATVVRYGRDAQGIYAEVEIKNTDSVAAAPNTRVRVHPSVLYLPKPPKEGV